MLFGPHAAMSLLLWCCILVINIGTSIAAGTCHGRIPNPVTDVCWRCVFPVTIGGTPVATMGQIDTPTDAPMTCACPTPQFPWVRFGVGSSFWEGVRIAEVVRTPYCSPTLDGTQLMDVGTQKQGDNGRADKPGKAFYHVHWYYFPVMALVDMFTDYMCGDSVQDFDLLYMTELDPLWSNDELAYLLAPEGILFGNIAAYAACSADCVSASAGFPIDRLFWCGGCQGLMYPMSGHTWPVESGIEAGLLAIYRAMGHLWRLGLAGDSSSRAAMCSPVPLPGFFVKKSQYKFQMLYPVPSVTTAQPYGRSTSLWAAGREIPIIGEDFSYVLWRKRVCCASVY